MVYLAVTKLIQTPDGLLVAVDYFDALTMQMVVGYTDVSFENTMNDFLSDMGLAMALVLPVTREQFREIYSQADFGVHPVQKSNPFMYAPSRN